MRTLFRPPIGGNIFGAGADAPVPDLATLQCRDPASTGIAAENAAQCRGYGTRARPQSRPLEDGQTLSRALDARKSGFCGPAPARGTRGGAVGANVASAAAPYVRRAGQARCTAPYARRTAASAQGARADKPF